MSKLIDSQELTPTQTVDLYEGGVIWLHDNGTRQDIELDAESATKLYDFLLLHMDRIHRAAQPEKIRRYNEEMDRRNRIVAENREKPWLPLHDGE